MRDDLMRRLAAARPDHLDPAERPDDATRSAELVIAMAPPRESTGPAGLSGVRHRGGSRGVRPAWGLGAVGVTAAALAVATFAAGTGGTGGTGRDSTSALGTEAGPTVLPARAVLLAAAHEADRRPAADGRYWHVKSTAQHLFRTGGGQNAYTVVSTQNDEQWTAYDPRDITWSTSRQLGTRPLGAADQEAWRRAGSPTSFAVGSAKLGGDPKDATSARNGMPAAPGAPSVSVRGPDDAKVTWQGEQISLRELRRRVPGRSGGPAPRPVAEGTADGEIGDRIGVSGLVGGDKIFWLGRNVSMKDLRSLPSDPAELKSRLLRWYGGHGTESDSGKVSSDEWLFDVVRGLILDMPVKPPVRAAAFRMLAGLDDVRVIDNVKTGSGRLGTAVAINKTNPSGVQEERIIFDRRTGMGIGDAIIVVKPKGMTAGLAPGTVWTSRQIEAGWTDTAPDLLK